MPGYSRRSEVCVDEATGLETDVQNCIDTIPDKQLETLKECNTVLCEPVYYDVSEWDECDCDSNIKTRNVICVEVSSKEEVSNDKCVAAGLKPVASETTCDKDECDSDPDRRRSNFRKILQDSEEEEEEDLCINITCSSNYHTNLTNYFDIY